MTPTPPRDVTPLSDAENCEFLKLITGERADTGTQCWHLTVGEVRNILSALRAAERPKPDVGMQQVARDLLDSRDRRFIEDGTTLDVLIAQALTEAHAAGERVGTERAAQIAESYPAVPNRYNVSQPIADAIRGHKKPLSEHAKQFLEMSDFDGKKHAAAIRKGG